MERWERGGKESSNQKKSWLGRILAILQGKWHKIPQDQFEYWEDEEENSRENPYLHKLRRILEQVLSQYQMSYREFHPLLVDTDTPPESLLDEDQVEVVLEQISEDLNFLRIATDRPAYFSDYIQRMYEDSGLVVQTEPKGQVLSEDVNVILDMEQQGNCPVRYMREHTLYIPVYKRKWNRVETLENLDISIPIGYNTVIVKGV